MELVEQLGSGIPRILQFYDRECFYFSDNYVRMSFPAEQVTEQVTEQVNRIIAVIKEEMTVRELMEKLKIKHRPTFLYNYLKPALELGLIEMTMPNKPNSPNQKYRLTVLGNGFKIKENEM